MVEPNRQQILIGIALRSTESAVASARDAFIKGKHVKRPYTARRIRRAVPGLTPDGRRAFDRWMVAAELAHAEEASATVAERQQEAHEAQMARAARTWRRWMEEEITRTLAEEIRNEIDAEILRTLRLPDGWEEGTSVGMLPA